MAASTLPAPTLSTEPDWRERLFPNNERVLVLVLLAECVVFSLTGNNFLTATNAFEVTRLSVEIGLLALVLTPVIISGGIDLSVGSMMGLAAVVMGALWRDAGVPIAIAAGVAVLVGVLGGSLNALMIARLKFPPLIVTLGTFSLFRGIAEGLTGGIENYSGFSSEFLFLGQGYVFGVIPTQLLVLVVAIAAIWMAAASREFRSRALRDRSFAGGCSVRRDQSRTAPGHDLRSFGNCCQHCGDCLRGPSGPGEIRCGYRLRTDGDYRSRFRRRLNFRRTRNDPRNCARTIRHRDPAKRLAAQRAAF